MGKMTPKRKVGRPLLPGTKRRGKTIKVRVTADEWKRLKSAARKHSKTVADLVREAMLRP